MVEKLAKAKNLGIKDSDLRIKMYLCGIVDENYKIKYRLL